MKVMQMGPNFTIRIREGNKGVLVKLNNADRSLSPNPKQGFAVSLLQLQVFDVRVSG